MSEGETADVLEKPVREPLGEQECYCVCCRGRRPFLEPELKTFGEEVRKTAYSGKCGECGRTVLKFTGSNQLKEPRPRGYYDARKREAKLERRRRAVLESAVPVKAAYWDESAEEGDQ